jgi:hypothetical protein
VAKQGDSVQSMAGASGKNDWQAIASANGIEDPLRISPGQFIDLNAGISAPSVSIGASVDVSASVGGGSLNASLGGAASGSLSFG